MPSAIQTAYPLILKISRTFDQQNYEDLAHDVVEKLLHTPNPDYSPNYLYTIIRNRFLDRLKSENIRHALPIEYGLNVPCCFRLQKDLSMTPQEDTIEITQIAKDITFEVIKKILNLEGNQSNKKAGHAPRKTIMQIFKTRKFLRQKYA